MKKYKNIDEYLQKMEITRDDLKDMIAYSSIHLATDCARNFDETPEITQQVIQPIYFFNEILDMVE